MSPTRTVLAGLAASALAASLTACGGPSTGTEVSRVTPSMASPASTPAASTSAPSTPAPSTPAPSTSFGDQDVNFTADMIGHHRQAIQMAGLAAGRTTNPKVLALATQIAAAQGPEITRMSGWLTTWGKPLPEDMGGMDMGGMDMGGSMPGIMSAADLKKLTAARGPAFDRQFLTMMIAHHEGAVTMARTQIAAGVNSEVTALARKVVTDQTAEITQMRSMLG